MLTKQQRVYQWIRPGRSISSDRLDDECLRPLARAIAVYRRMIGHALGRVRDATRAALTDFRPDRVEAVIKLLDDAATYEWPRGGRQAEVRLRVFEAAAALHPLLDPAQALATLRAMTTLRAAMTSHAAMTSPAAIGGDGTAHLDDGEPLDAVPTLYADYPESHRLRAFPADYSAGALRADYDLAQAQALLYDATQVTVDAAGDLRHIVQYARLSRLLYRLERKRDGYRLVFDGPNSILRRTHTYGVDFARFLAALVQARGWTMTADVVLRPGWRPVTFTLTDADGLRSRVPAPALFDSQLEERFAEKFGAVRDGWRLARETLILEAGELLVVPDFVFTHEDGTEVAMEIVGYWTPQYLEQKLAKLRGVRGANLIVAVRKTMAVGAGSVPGTVLPFGTGILLREIMPRLEAFRPAQEMRRPGSPARRSVRGARE
jgi:predicted nuclease of restriction endonuclease-like RecB superfamily